MKPALLLVDHGSRIPEANAALEQIAEGIRAAEPDRIVLTAHMELARPGIAEALDACAAAGAREVVVVPCFLSPGGHATSDVPRLAREAASRHAGLSLRVAEPLGPHPKLAEIALERAAEALARG
jgi:sirohydrochlorin ferrochelatase